LVCQSFQVSLWMRRAGAPADALRVALLANSAMRDLVRDTPNDPGSLYLLSVLWYEVGKIYWDLNKVEETLTACRNAIAAQHRLFERVRTEEKRALLGSRYMQLGRKLCELGRLDEAEACFCDRQALWPGDTGKYEEVLRELRKWASECGVTPAARQERQRY